MDAIQQMNRFGKFLDREDAYFLLLLDEVVENEKNRRICKKGEGENGDCS